LGNKIIIEWIFWIGFERMGFGLKFISPFPTRAHMEMGREWGDLAVKFLFGRKLMRGFMGPNYEDEWKEWGRGNVSH
jgi:hypothetical protein